MGPEAVEINNMFMEVIRPIVARLTKIGVIQNRDYRTVRFSASILFSFLPVSDCSTYCQQINT